jgi:hypothetical protein
VQSHLQIVSSNDEPVEEPKPLSPFIAVPLRASRTIVFRILLALRRPVRFLCHLIAIPALIFAGIYGYMRGWLTPSFGTMISISIAAFALAWVYDVVLFVLGPDGLILYD